MLTYKNSSGGTSRIPSRIDGNFNRINGNSASVTIPSPVDFQYGGQGYMLKFGVAQAVKGKLTKIYFTGAYKPEFEVRTFTKSAYDERVATVRGRAAAGEIGNASGFAAAVTRLFLNEPPTTQSYTPDNVSSPPLKKLNAHFGTQLSSSLTHIAGSHFSNDKPGTGAIPHFIFGRTSSPAREASPHRSTAMFKILVSYLKYYKYDIDRKLRMSAGAPVNYPIHIPNQMVNWDKLDGDDGDIYLAIGHVSLTNATINITVAQVDGRTEIQDLRFTGTLLDLTDYDYTGVYPSNPASIVQIGWEPHPGAAYSRDKGRIFYTDVEINTLYTKVKDDHFLNSSPIDPRDNSVRLQVGW